jgi:hypothetical protein
MADKTNLFRNVETPVAGYQPAPHSRIAAAKAPPERRRQAKMPAPQNRQCRNQSTARIPNRSMKKFFARCDELCGV